MEQERCALTLRTALSGQTIERLLSGACMKPYSVAFEGMEETPKGNRKIIKISFDVPEDLQRFRLQLHRLASTVPNSGRESEVAH